MFDISITNVPLILGAYSDNVGIFTTDIKVGLAVLAFVRTNDRVPALALGIPNEHIDECFARLQLSPFADLPTCFKDAGLVDGPDTTAILAAPLSENDKLLIHDLSKDLACAIKISDRAGMYDVAFGSGTYSVLGIPFFGCDRAIQEHVTETARRLLNQFDRVENALLKAKASPQYALKDPQLTLLYIAQRCLTQSLVHFFRCLPSRLTLQAATLVDDHIYLFLRRAGDFASLADFVAQQDLQGRDSEHLRLMCFLDLRRGGMGFMERRLHAAAGRMGAIAHSLSDALDFIMKHLPSHQSRDEWAAPVLADFNASLDYVVTMLPSPTTCACLSLRTSSPRCPPRSSSFRLQASRMCSVAATWRSSCPTSASSASGTGALCATLRIRSPPSSGASGQSTQLSSPCALSFPDAASSVCTPARLWAPPSRTTI